MRLIDRLHNSIDQSLGMYEHYFSPWNESTSIWGRTDFYGYAYHPPRNIRYFQSLAEAVEWVKEFEPSVFGHGARAITFRPLFQPETIKVAWAYSNLEAYDIPKSREELFQKLQDPAYIPTISPGMLEWIVFVTKDAYYNTDAPLLSDAVYDSIEECLTKKYPESPVLAPGVVTRALDDGLLAVGMRKYILPFHVGGLNKIRINPKKFPYPGPYLITEKLDGVALLYAHIDNKIRLSTRGNGTMGQDVSHMIDALGLPGLPNGWAVRGELIMPREIFRQKYAKDFKNPRNMVSGMLNTKNVDRKKAWDYKHPALSDVEFVTFEILSPRSTSFSEGLRMLKAQGFTIPANKRMTMLKRKQLTRLLQQRKQQSRFEVDGLVVYDDNFHAVNDSGNPPWAFAFKSEQSTEKEIATVTGIEWNVSRHGQVKPVVLFDAVDLSGVSVSRATGHHAKYIQDNGIGVGARIRVTRSGDVIPYIVDVVKNAPKNACDAAMPSCEWQWDDTKTNAIVVENELPDTQQSAARLLHQLQLLDIEHIGKKKAAALAEHGYSTIDMLDRATPEDLTPLIGPKLSKTIQETIRTAMRRTITEYGAHHKTPRGTDHTLLLQLSGLLPKGIGKQRIESLLRSYATVTSWSPKQCERDTPPPSLFSAQSFKEVLSILPKYRKWLESWNIANHPAILKDLPFVGDVYLFTGFRDKELEKKVQARGASVATTFSSKVTCVIAKDVDSESTKCKQAREANIPVLSIQYLKCSLLTFGRPHNESTTVTTTRLGNHKN